MKCKYCGSNKIIKNGFKYRKKKKPYKRQKYVCNKCFKGFINDS